MSNSEPNAQFASDDRGWRMRCRDDAVILHLSGELDISSAVALQTLLSAAMWDGLPRIIVDLSDVDFIDGYSIGLIVGAWTAARDRGLLLTVEGVHGLPKDLFNVLELQPLLAQPADARIGGSDGAEYRRKETAG